MKTINIKNILIENNIISLAKYKLKNSLIQEEQKSAEDGLSDTEENLIGGGALALVLAGMMKDSPKKPPNYSATSGYKVGKIKYV